MQRFGQFTFLTRENDRDRFGDSSESEPTGRKLGVPAHASRRHRQQLMADVSDVKPDLYLMKLKNVNLNADGALAGGGGTGRWER